MGGNRLFLSTPLPADVGAGEGMFGRFKELLSGRVFDEAPGVFLDPEEADVVGDAAGLGEVVGDDDDGVAAAEAGDHVFDDAAGEGVEGAARFVEEEDFGF